jgi:hypothetical protein
MKKAVFYAGAFAGVAVALFVISHRRDRGTSGVKPSASQGVPIAAGFPAATETKSIAREIPTNTANSDSEPASFVGGVSVATFNGGNAVAGRSDATSAVPPQVIAAGSVNSSSTSPQSEEAASENMYLAHASLRNPEWADPDSESNRRTLQAMVFKAIANRTRPIPVATSPVQ